MLLTMNLAISCVVSFSVCFLRLPHLEYCVFILRVLIRFDNFFLTPPAPYDATETWASWEMKVQKYFPQHIDISQTGQHWGLLCNWNNIAVYIWIINNCGFNAPRTQLESSSRCLQNISPQSIQWPGLAPITIAWRWRVLHIFCASSPSGVRSKDSAGEWLPGWCWSTHAPLCEYAACSERFSDHIFPHPPTYMIELAVCRCWFDRRFHARKGSLLCAVLGGFSYGLLYWRKSRIEWETISVVTNVFRIEFHAC